MLEYIHKTTRSERTLTALPLPQQTHNGIRKIIDYIYAAEGKVILPDEAKYCHAYWMPEALPIPCYQLSMGLNDNL